MIVPSPLVTRTHLCGDYWRPKIDGQCFSSVYLGVNMDEKEKQEIIKLARKLNPNIKIYQMKVNPNAFKLDCEIVAQPA
jgi:hypothetical protein